MDYITVENTLYKLDTQTGELTRIRTINCQYNNKLVSWNSTKCDPDQKIVAIQYNQGIDLYTVN
jgi:hypothetical protein